MNNKNYEKTFTYKGLLTKVKAEYISFISVRDGMYLKFKSQAVNSMCELKLNILVIS